jgi:ribosomal RNA-processing protein 9
MTDFVATGSHDGFLRLWNANAEDRVLNPTASIPIDGFINSIALSKRMIVVGVGNEHRLGRWWRLNKVKNCVKIIKLPDFNESRRIEDNINSESEDDDENDAASSESSEESS